jgi:hypothetical protein
LHLTVHERMYLRAVVLGGLLRRVGQVSLDNQPQISGCPCA